MRSLFPVAVVCLALGVLALNPSDAQATWWRRPVVVNYYPAPVPVVSSYVYTPTYYPPPVYSSYSYYPGGIYVGPLRPVYAPAPVYVTPGYSSYYYGPGYYYPR
jgi:hypothetical protein